MDAGGWEMTAKEFLKKHRQGICSRCDSQQTDPCDRFGCADVAYVDQALAALEAEKPAETLIDLVDSFDPFARGDYIHKDDMINLIQQYMERNCAACKDMKLDDLRHGRTAPIDVDRWIPVTEKMPPKNSEGLVSDGKKLVTCMRYSGNEYAKNPRPRFEWMGHVNFPWTITHWQSLPEAPK